MSNTVDAKFHDDLIAELVAINMALHRVIHSLADLSEDRAQFLDQQLEKGLAAIPKTNLWSVPTDRRELVCENACARFQDIIGSIRS